MEAQDESREPPHRRGPRIVYVLFFGLVSVGFAAWAAFQLISVSNDLRDAQDLIDIAATSLEDGELARARDVLSDAEALVVGANDRLRTSVFVDVISWVPVISDNVAAIEDSIDLGLTVVHGGRRILDEGAPLESDGGTLEVSLSDGSLPTEAIEETRQEISNLLVQLVTTSEPKDSGLLAPPVRQLRDDIVDEATERHAQLRVLDSGLQLLEEFAGLHDPRRYLLAVANTAEMRGSGGMILNYGVLEGRDGTVDLTAFGRVDEIALAGPVSEDLVPADYLARWNGFDQLRRWRQANLSADFTVVAPVLEAMYTSATDRPVDGVIQVDPEGLAAILEGVGPVQVGELGEVNADNVVQLTMHEAYVQFPGVEERSDVLGDVAEAAFRKLVDGDIPSLRALATAIAEAVDGRHILSHSTNDTIQRAFVGFGADGGLPPFDGPDAFSLTAQNLSGHKLDYFLDTSLQLTGDRPAGEAAEVTATVTLANTAPAGTTEPRYIYGPGPSETTSAGTIRSVVTVYLPAGTSHTGKAGDAPVEQVTSGTEAGRAYVSFTIDVPASQARTVSLSLELAPRPPGDYEVVFVPSPRIRPTVASVDLNLGGGRLSAEVVLDRTWIVGTDREPRAHIAPIYRPRFAG